MMNKSILTFWCTDQKLIMGLTAIAITRYIKMYEQCSYSPISVAMCIAHSRMLCATFTEPRYHKKSVCLKQKILIIKE